MMQIPGLDSDILLIDDDPLVLTLLQTLITNRSDLSVRTVGSLEMAMPLLRSAASGSDGRLPRAIIVDWNLGSRTAKEFITWVRISATMGHIPIYAISSDESRSLSQDAFDAGAREFATKSELMSKFDRWLDQTASEAA